jgi:hypothetical protein
MFPSLGILQHYAEFNICTITTFEKLFGVRSFGVFIGHLTYRQAILPTFSSKFSFLFYNSNYCLCILGMLGIN